MVGRSLDSLRFYMCGHGGKGCKTQYVNFTDTEVWHEERGMMKNPDKCTQDTGWQWLKYDCRFMVHTCMADIKNNSIF